MFFSKVTFRNMRNLGGLIDNEYRMHQMVWDLMPVDPNQHRTFLYRQVTHPIPTIYILSQTALRTKSEAFEVESKKFEPVLRKHMRLQFSVRVNPVVSKYNEAGNVANNGKKRSRRHDVVKNKKMSLKQKGESSQSMQEIVHSAVSRWLISRAEMNGFLVVPESLMISGYTQRELFKKQSLHPIRLSTVDISGFLTVEDVQKFTACLKGGLGPAKGFGCGLMLIKPCR
jgi:CRISPR system Cascade subunit CasE